jgi:hypothetical protein
MQMQSNGQVQRSAAQWGEIIARYRQSGMESRQFCEAEGLTLRTFEKWYGGIRRSETGKGKFVEVKAPRRDNGTVGGGGGIVQRRAPAGARVRRCGSRPRCAGFWPTANRWTYESR